MTFRQYGLYTLITFFLLPGVEAKECQRSLSELGRSAHQFDDLTVEQKTDLLVEAYAQLSKTRNQLRASQDERGAPSLKDLQSKLGLSVEQMENYLNFKTAKDLDEIQRLARSRFPKTYGQISMAAADFAARFFEENFYWPNQEELGEYLGLIDWEADSKALFGDHQAVLDAARSHYPKRLEKVKKKVIQAYARMARQFRRIPKEEEVAEEIEIEYQDFLNLMGPDGLFKDFEAVKEQTREHYPASFRNVVDTDAFGRAHSEEFLERLKSADGALVSSAVAGSKVNRKAFEALKTMAKKRNLVIAILPVNMQTDGLDPILIEDPNVFIITQTLLLNPHLRIDRLKVTAKQMNPLMSTERIGNRQESVIFGAPKMHLKTVSTDDRIGQPRQLMSTGAITDANYDAERYIGWRTDHIAEHDHLVGALVLEKENGRGDFYGEAHRGGFHIRHLEFIPEEEGFYDDGEFFAASGKAQEEHPQAVIYEPHPGNEYESLNGPFADLIRRLGPKMVIGHDVFNGHSVSHHDRKSTTARANRANKNELNLEREIQQLAAHINAILALDPKLHYTVIPANHNNWLHQYLDSMDYKDDPENFDYALELHLEMRKGRDPLEYALLHSRTQTSSDYGPAVPPLVDDPHRVSFLDPKSDHMYRIGPNNRLVSVGHHGDKGSNGGRGSARQFEQGLDRAVWGHSHGDERRNAHVQIGTTGNLRMGYNNGGLSSWTNSIGVVGPNSEIQILRWRSSEFRRPRDEKVTEPEKFWPQGYPAIEESKAGFDPEQGPKKGQFSVGR